MPAGGSHVIHEVHGPSDTCTHCDSFFENCCTQSVEDKQQNAVGRIYIIDLDNIKFKCKI